MTNIYTLKDSKISGQFSLTHDNNCSIIAASLWLGFTLRLILEIESVKKKIYGQQLGLICEVPKPSDSWESNENTVNIKLIIIVIL